MSQCICKMVPGLCGLDVIDEPTCPVHGDHLPAQGIETRSAKTARLGPQDESPVLQDAPSQPIDFTHSRTEDQ